MIHINTAIEFINAKKSLHFLYYRLQELADIKASGLKSFRDIIVDEANILVWNGMIVPVSSGLFFCFYNSFKNRFFSIYKDNPPYNKGAFKIEITFPAEYPFKPPKICFKTKIYHPNIDEKGQVCLPIISAENWKPATKTDQGKQLYIYYFTTHYQPK